MAKGVIVIMGMRSNAWRERVCSALGGVTGVHEVNVSLLRARATIAFEAPCDMAALVWTIVKAGYGAALEAPGADEGAPGAGA
jgi:copper chaperone CopZ